MRNLATTTLLLAAQIATIQPVTSNSHFSKAPRNYAEEESQRQQRQLAHKSLGHLSTTGKTKTKTEKIITETVAAETEPKQQTTPTTVKSKSISVATATCGNGIVEGSEECDSGFTSANGMQGNGAPYDPCDTNCQWKYNQTACTGNFRDVQLFMSTDQYTPTQTAFFVNVADGSESTNLHVWNHPIGSLDGDSYYHWTSCVDPFKCHQFDFFDLQDYSNSDRSFSYTLLSDGVLMSTMSSEHVTMSFFTRKQLGRGCPAMPTTSA